MKTNKPHVLTLGAALLLAPLTPTSAQSTWEAVDALGNICVVGDVENGTPSAYLAPIRRLAAP